jgi:hypothetical protein
MQVLWSTMFVCVFCSVRLVRDETKGRPLLISLGLGGLCTCTSQPRSLPANTTSYLTLLDHVSCFRRTYRPSGHYSMEHLVQFATSYGLMERKILAKSLCLRYSWTSITTMAQSILAILLPTANMSPSSGQLAISFAAALRVHGLNSH